MTPSWIQHAIFTPTFSASDSDQKLGQSDLRKVGQTDLVFDVRSGFIGTSVQARLQVSVCSGYDLFHPG